jgi:hypothetical protein
MSPWLQSFHGLMTWRTFFRMRVAASIPRRKLFPTSFWIDTFQVACCIPGRYAKVCRLYWPFQRNCAACNFGPYPRDWCSRDSKLREQLNLPKCQWGRVCLRQPAQCACTGPPWARLVTVRSCVKRTRTSLNEGIELFKMRNVSLSCVAWAARH